MAEVAHRALSLVLGRHAGCLGSYASDKRACLRRAYELVEAGEAQVRSIYSIQGDQQKIEPLRNAVVERIRCFAPELLPVPDSRLNPAPFCCLTIERVRGLYLQSVQAEARNKRRRTKR